VCRLAPAECVVQSEAVEHGTTPPKFGSMAGILFGWQDAHAPNKHLDQEVDDVAGKADKEGASSATRESHCDDAVSLSPTTSLTPGHDSTQAPASAKVIGAVEIAESTSPPAATAAPILGPRLVPRVFVVSNDGRTTEFLRPDVYDDYVHGHRGAQGITELESDMPSGSMRVHRFIHHLVASPKAPAPLPIAEGVTNQPPESIRAVSALRVPWMLYPPVTAGLVLPRVAACRTPHEDTSRLPQVLLMCEFLIQTPPTEETLQAYTAVISAYNFESTTQRAAEEAHAHAAKEAHAAADGSSSMQASLVERLIALKATATQRAEAVAMQERATREALALERVAAEKEAEERIAEEVAGNIKEYRTWQPVVGEFDTCQQVPKHGHVLKYFECEDGIRAAQMDPLLGGHMPNFSKSLPTRPGDSAAATAFATAGVYRAMCADPAADADHPPAATHCDKQAKHEGGHMGGEGGFSNGYKSPLYEAQASVPAPDFTYPAMGLGAFNLQPRATRIAFGTSSAAAKLPSIYKMPQAVAELNKEVLQREYETMRLANTSSAALVRARGRDGSEFALGCRALNLGNVSWGVAVSRKIPLQNVSLGAARFSVDQVTPPLRLAYPRKPVPAGLKVPIAVHFCAAEGTALGVWAGEIVVRSAFNVLRCPVMAFVSAGPAGGVGAVPPELPELPCESHLSAAHVDP
jgi:hypothetical protein